jgi:hypothetical protein
METHMANKGRQAFNNLVKAKAKQAKAARETTTRKAKNAAEVVVSADAATQAEAPAVQAEQAQPAAQQAAAPSTAPKAAPAPKAPREERNGVKRPRENGKCWQVWNHLDQHGNMEAKDLREVAVAKGWNVNNCLIELSQWRKFSGVGKPKK